MHFTAKAQVTKPSRVNETRRGPLSAQDRTLLEFIRWYGLFQKQCKNLLHIHMLAFGIPKFQRILNAFGLKYAVMLELDGKDEEHPQNAPILNELNGNRVAKIPSNLETLLGLAKHFDDQRHARQFFADSNNINNDMEAVVAQLLP